MFWLDLHVRAILTVEDQREALRRADAKQDEGSQVVVRVLQQGGVHTLVPELLAQELAHIVSSHAGEQRGFQTQPGGAYGDVARATAKVLPETLGIFQRTEDLLGVQIHRHPPHADEVKNTGGVKRTGSAGHGFRVFQVDRSES